MKLVLTIAYALAVCVAHAQTAKEVQASEAIKRWGMRDHTYSNQIPIVPPGPGERVNEVYLDLGWKRASVAVYTTDKLLDGWPVRYDLRANVLEIQFKNDLKVLEARHIKSMLWLDSGSNVPHNFVNGKEYKIDGTPLTSLIEVLTEGKLTLYKQYTFWIKKPDFNPALNVGSIDERIYKKDLFFYSADKDLHPVPTKKKGLLSVFGDQANLVAAYIKDRDLDLDVEWDLVRIFDYYNSLK